MWFLFISLVAFWFILYFGLTIVFKNKPLEWSNRIVTLVHSLVVCRLVEYSMYTEDPFSRIGGLNTANEERTLLFSWSYFIFDSTWCVYMNSEDPLMLIHHFIGVFMLPLAFIFNSNAAEIALALWAGELTNPFLQYRYFFKFHNKQESRMAYWNDFFFALVFVFIRIGFLSVLCYYFVTAPHTALIVKVFGVAFYVVGVVWSYKIIGFVKRKLFSNKIIQ